MPLVRTERLTKAFGALTAVNEVTLEVAEGSLHSVIGPNGAGKTTFFNLLTGQHAPTSAGSSSTDGHRGTPPHRIAHLGIARSFQRTSIFPTLSILDNVWLATFARQKSWRVRRWSRSAGPWSACTTRRASRNWPGVCTTPVWRSGVVPGVRDSHVPSGRMICCLMAGC
jgi:ABC-type branched-subunit amino acid transport system ATPase component